MKLTPELKKIKKIYGEEFMHLCRKLFPTILEEEGKLLSILLSKFNPNSPTICEDIITYKRERAFADYINAISEKKELSDGIQTDKTPYELLEEAGYELIECRTEEEIERFRRYYREDEELCTFGSNRLESCIVFFAVRKDADRIKREDFDKPEREDEYGTSVLSIQFNREGLTTVSIKNRYNHTVDNPDATYGNDLDKIAPGLSISFANLLRERGFNVDKNNILESLSIPGYVLANDGKYYKYNMRVEDTYYCAGNVVIEDGNVTVIENPEQNILVDYFVIDLKNKTIKLFDQSIEDSFVDGLNDIEKIEVKNNPENKKERIITIKKKGKDGLITIKIDANNNIISYENNLLKHIGNGFLKYNQGLRQLALPNVTDVGDKFLLSNHKLETLDMENVEKFGNLCLKSAITLEEVNFPKLREIGDKFLFYNIGMKRIDLQSVKKIGNDFFAYDSRLEEVIMPNVEEIGEDFLASNKTLNELSFEKIKKIGKDFLRDHPMRKKIKRDIRFKIFKRMITPKDLSKLDSSNNVTRSEIEEAKHTLIRERSIDSKERID